MIYEARKKKREKKLNCTKLNTKNAQRGTSLQKRGQSQKEVLKEVDLNIHAKVFDLWLGFGKTCKAPNSRRSKKTRSESFYSVHTGISLRPSPRLVNHHPNTAWPQISRCTCTCNRTVPTN